MTAISFVDGTIQIDPALVARGLRLEPDQLRQALRDGRVTSLCEKGEAEDAGRWRITFWSPDRRLRLIFDSDGRVLKSSAADLTRKPGPASGA
jgi:hypothetical protein